MRGKWETGQEKRGEDEEVITDYRITENYRDKDPETGWPPPAISSYHVNLAVLEMTLNSILSYHINLVVLEMTLNSISLIYF